jgi:phospholipid/cholesterol/gamma-HCH transport system permease protein
MGASPGTGSVVNRLQTPLVLVGGFFRMCVLTGKALFRSPFSVA